MNQNIVLTESQQRILKQLQDFVYRSSDRIFVLKGYAGTGKTTMMKFLIDDLTKHHRGFSLLSTTGRAAKVLANYTDHSTSTIHGLIYKFKDLNKDLSDIDVDTAAVGTTGQLFLVFEPTHLTDDDRKENVYIVDEASMISDKETIDPVQAVFGSGRLLKELLDFDTFTQSKFVFVGDPCQLPPVNGETSPALNAQYFETTFQQHAQEANLTEIMRQDNSIISAGAYIRKLWEKAPMNESYYPVKVWGPPLQLSVYQDIDIHADLYEMEAHYINNIKKNGYNDSVFICNSNLKCVEVANRVRAALGFSGSVKKGDLLLVVQNQNTTGLMNGDMVEVVEVSPVEERIFREVNSAGYRTTLTFREIKVRELFSKKVYTTLLLESLLDLRRNNLDSYQQSGLFLDFILRMKRKGITQKNNKAVFDNLMRNDPYLNALRCSYGYAVTCHKAQGGEWNSVYVQLPRDITLKPIKSKYQWLYTALTRAKNTVHICRDFFIQ